MGAAEYLIISTTLLTGIACIVIPLLSSHQKWAGAFVFILLNSIITSVAALKALLGQSTVISFYGGSVFGDILLRIDPLAAWFMLIVNLSCINGVLYGMSYMKPYELQQKNTSLHWSMFVVLHASMLWVCSLRHGLCFLIAWEIMSISCFLLVIFDHARIKTIRAGINYLVQAHIGVACLSVAFIWIALSEGTYDFNVMPTFFSKPDSIWVFILLFIGFGLKAGFIPLHTWLPHAHPAAPSHVSGVMSGVVVKMGIYGIIRVVIYLTVEVVAIGEFILILSVLTSFYGILNAAIHRDFKRMLAFCTIENIGIIGMGIGIGLIGKGIGKPEIMILGFSAALLHTLNHSLYKSLLFFASGTIYQLTHTRNMEHLGGLIKTIPVTAFLFLLGSLSVAGLPPFNGFVSKFLLYSSLIEGIKVDSFQLNVIMVGCIVGLAIAGGISILTFTKSFAVIFLGSPRNQLKQHKQEVLSYTHIPFFIITFLILLIAVFPSLVLMPIQRIVYAPGVTLPVSNPYFTVETFLSDVGGASMILILMIGFILLVRTRIAGTKPSNYSPTWGCGYVAPNYRMQYTGKSFSKTFAKLFAFITGEQKKYTEIERHSVFPSDRSYQSNYPEYFEKNIIDKALNQLFHFMNQFSFIHNGKVQRYVLYGFLFIMTLLVATLYNIL